jgi:hypothetical protein
MKSRIIYILVLGTFLMAFFGCGKGTANFDAESYINERAAAIEADPAILDDAIADQTIVEHFVDLESCLSVSTPLPDPAPVMSRITASSVSQQCIEDPGVIRIDDGTPSMPPMIWCDINDDGILSGLDAVLLANVLSGREHVSYSLMTRCDVNIDGMLDAKDLFFLLHYFRGLIDTLPAVDYRAFGDANGNGEVNGIDVGYALGIMRGEIQDTMGLIAADLNGNGIVDESDIDQMVGYLRFQTPSVLPYVQGLMTLNLAEIAAQEMSVQRDDPLAETTPLGDILNVF